MKEGTGGQRAVFLDRDGVLIEDVDLLTRVEQLKILPGVPESLARLRRAGFRLLVVTNQTVVARGMCSEADVAAVNARMDAMLQAAGAPPLDGVYVCPHHPSGTLEAYRVDCECRKPRPGLLVRGAREHGVDLGRSYIVGDRITDVGAGARAGCRTVLVQTGRHTAAPIQSGDPVGADVKPDHVARDFAAATDWILGRD